MSSRHPDLTGASLLGSEVRAVLQLVTDPRGVNTSGPGYNYQHIANRIFTIRVPVNNHVRVEVETIFEESVCECGWWEVNSAVND